MEKFTNGDIWKPINIPNTYKKLKAKPQGILAFIKSPIKGIIEAADIIFLVLVIGGLIGIMNLTGAFDAGICLDGQSIKRKRIYFDNCRNFFNFRWWNNFWSG